MNFLTDSVPLFDAASFRQRHFDTSVNWTSLFLPGFSQFMIHRIESYNELVRFPLPPHRKNIYDFIFLTGGHTIRTKELDTYELGPHTFFFLPAHQITSTGAVSADATGFYCHFDADLFRQSAGPAMQPDSFPFLQLTAPPLLPVPPTAVPVVNFMLDRLLTEYENTHADRLPLIGLYLQTLFTEIKRLVPPAPAHTGSAARRITRQFKTALSHHIYDRQQVAQYAELLCVTPNHLNKCVRQTLGQTAHQLIDEMLLLEAKVLLRQTSLTVGEIAYQLNQNDPGDFGRFFKHKTGLTLTRYRAMD
jgi:AraC family transcriptional regulator, transcriptional activator of pobA